MKTKEQQAKEYAEKLPHYQDRRQHAAGEDGRREAEKDGEGRAKKRCSFNHKDENRANNAVENLEWCDFRHPWHTRYSEQ